MKTSKNMSKLCSLFFVCAAFCLAFLTYVIFMVYLNNNFGGNNITIDNTKELAEWCEGKRECFMINPPKFWCMHIETSEGVIYANIDDWIIKNAQAAGGEFSVCRSDIFEKTYEKVEEI